MPRERRRRSRVVPKLHRFCATREEVAGGHGALRRRDPPYILATDADLEGEPISEPLAALVRELPPKERAAVLLKDVLQYRLAEVAEVVDSTVGGVKAALRRGRSKLRTLQAAPSQSELDREQQKLVEAYVEYFNCRDWDALGNLIQADATLEVVDGTFGKYAMLAWEWKLSLGRVDGEPVVVHWKKVGADWRPHAAIRLWWQRGKVVRIRDYARVDYVLQDAATELDEAAQEIA